MNYEEKQHWAKITLFGDKKKEDILGKNIEIELQKS